MGLCLSSVGLAVGVAARSALALYSHGRLESLVDDEAAIARISGRLKDYDRQSFALTLFNALATVVFVGSFFAFRGPSGAAPSISTFVLAFLFSGVILSGFVRALVSLAAERVLLLTLGFVVAIDRLFLPLTFTIEMVAKVIGRGIGVDVDETEESEEVSEEILDVVAESEAGGQLEPDAAEFIENIVESRGAVVREIMTPRANLISASADIDFKEALALHNEEGHSRVPVWSESRDHIVGILYFKDVLRHVLDLQSGALKIRDLVRPAFFVPETRKINELLKDLQSQKIQVAVVLDEFGGTAGIVTVEDVLEEIVGELSDEFDDDEHRMKRLDAQRVEVAATVPIDDLNEKLDITIPDDGDYETVGGFLSARLGKVPAKGENYVFEDVRFEVVDADERKVKRVLVTVEPRAAEG